MSEPAGPQRRPGRPRGFDRLALVDRSVDVFWKHGLAGTTTRVLEDELGVSQSSLYNTYGSKDELLEESLTRYENRLQETVMSTLVPADRDSLLDFVDAVSGWVGHRDHRGCLIMNLATEDPRHGHRLKAFRTKLRRALRPAVRSFTPDKTLAQNRAEVLISSVLGLNVSARSGASPAELRGMAAAIKAQILAW